MDWTLLFDALWIIGWSVLFLIAIKLTKIILILLSKKWNTPIPTLCFILVVIIIWWELLGKMPDYITNTFSIIAFSYSLYELSKKINEPSAPKWQKFFKHLVYATIIALVILNIWNINIIGELDAGITDSISFGIFIILLSLR